MPATRQASGREAFIAAGAVIGIKVPECRNLGEAFAGVFSRYYAFA